MSVPTFRKILVEDFSMRKLCTKTVSENFRLNKISSECLYHAACLEQIEDDLTLIDHVIIGERGELDHLKRYEESTVALSRNIKTKKGKNEQVQNQNDDHLLF